MFEGSQYRKQFLHEGRVIYEWEESLDSVLVYIERPPLPENIKINSVLNI